MPPAPLNATRVRYDDPRGLTDEDIMSGCALAARTPELTIWNQIVFVEHMFLDHELRGDELGLLIDRFFAFAFRYDFTANPFEIVKVYGRAVCWHYRDDTRDLPPLRVTVLHHVLEEGPGQQVLVT